VGNRKGKPAKRKGKLALYLLVAAICAWLRGCTGFPEEPMESLPISGAELQTDTDTALLLGPGPDEEGLPGAEWSVYELMQQSGSAEGEGILVYIPDETAVFHSPDPGKANSGTIAAGTYIQVDANKSPLWFSSEEGWLYGEDLYPVIDDEPWEISLTEAVVGDRLSRLEGMFPSGKYWNHMGGEPNGDKPSPFSVTDKPCNHTLYDEYYCNQYNGSMLDLFPYSYLTQCLGFSCLLSDQIFGEDAPLYLLPESAPLRIGDHIRLQEYEHSMIVREVDEHGLRLAEVNADYEDCLISWEREFTWEEWENLYGWDVEYVISRYPFYQENGRWEPMEAIPAHWSSDSA